VSSIGRWPQRRRSITSRSTSTFQTRHARDGQRDRCQPSLDDVQPRHALVLHPTFQGRGPLQHSTGLVESRALLHSVRGVARSLRAPRTREPPISQRSQKKSQTLGSLGRGRWDRERRERENPACVRACMQGDEVAWVAWGAWRYGGRCSMRAACPRPAGEMRVAERLG